MSNAEDVTIPENALCLVACGKQKQNTYDETLEQHVPVPAGELYTSSYSVVKRKFANTCRDYRILSAEHGIVAPDQLLDYYDMNINDLPNTELDPDTPGTFAWRVERSLTAWVQRFENPTVVLLGGTDYIDSLRVVYDRVPAEVRFPLQEAELPGMMDQMGWLSDRTEARR